MNIAIIPAGGTGLRFQNARAKQFLELSSVPIIIHTLRHFERCEDINLIIVALPREEIESFEGLLNKFELNKSYKLVEGGSNRQESVYKALKAAPTNTKYIIIHDAVRPFISNELIKKVLNATQEYKAATVGYSVTDTIKEVQEEFIVTTPKREKLYAVQTPQGFEYKLLKAAHEKAIGENLQATDDAMLVERLEIPVRIVRGPLSNIKITHPEDLALAEFLLSKA